MNKLSRQDCINIVWKHAVVKGSLPSVDKKSIINLGSNIKMGNCSYRGDDGNKCFAGLLIPDNVYSEDMENQPMSDVCAEWDSVSDLFDCDTWGKENDFDFLDGLQQIHDRMFNEANSVGVFYTRTPECWSEEWKRVLTTFISDNKLEVPNGVFQPIKEDQSKRTHTA